MTVIAECSVPADGAVLADALGALGEAEVGLERVVGDGDRLVPYVWVPEGEIDRVLAAIESGPDVAAAETLNSVGGTVLVRAEWTGDPGVFGVLEDAGVTLLDGTGDAGGWSIQLRSPDRQALASLYAGCIDRGLSFEVDTVYTDGAGPAVEADARLTSTQRETLVTALDNGFFEVPRDASLDDLAGELGVSDSAVSQRIRRGVGTVVSTALVESAGDD